MKQFFGRSGYLSVPKKIWAVFGLVFLLSSLPLQSAPSEQSAGRKWHVQLSVFGGKWSGASFLQNFSLDSNGYMWLWTSGTEESAAWSKAASNFVPGGSLGVNYELNQRLKIHADLTFLSAMKFPDGIERDSQYYWDENLRDYVDQIVSRAQTARKARAAGFSLGAVWTPFSRIPAGLDVKIGLWNYKQEFVSGTCQYYGANAVMTNLVNRTEGKDVGEYQGQGKWEESHLALMLGIGLKYYPLRWLSVDLNWQLLDYLKNEYSGYVYVNSGNKSYDLVFYSLGSMLAVGLTFYY